MKEVHKTVPGALMLGNESISRGALEAGVSFAAGYPGTPSSEIIESLARQAEQRGFKGIYIPSIGATLPFCQSVLEATSEIEVVSSIQPIYYYNPRELAARIRAILPTRSSSWRWVTFFCAMSDSFRSGALLGSPRHK